MALKQQLTPQIDYIWLNDYTFDKNSLESIMISLGFSLKKEIQKLGNKLPPKNSLVYVVSYIFKIVEIKEEKLGFLRGKKYTISVSFIAEDQELAKKIEKETEHKPLGEFIDDYYAGYREIEGRNVKISILMSSIPEDIRDSSTMLDFCLVIMESILTYYIRVFGHYPSIGETLNNGTKVLVVIKEKYFFQADESKGETEDSLGFVVQFDYGGAN